jgi:hypothetical protein
MRDDDEEVINNIDDKQLQVPLAPCPASNTYTLQVREASFPAPCKFVRPHSPLPIPTEGGRAPLSV